MRTALRAYDWTIGALAVLAAAAFVFVAVAIVADVTLRNLDVASLIWVSAVVEYIMLFSTMAAGPWLVRVGGHVAVTSFVDFLPRGLRRAIGICVMIVSAGVLFWLGWRAAVLALDEVAFGSIDMRSINIPGWVAYALLSAGFGLMGTEVLRQIGRGARNLASRQGH